MKSISILCMLVFCSLLAAAQKDKPVPPDMPRSEEDNQVYYMDVVSEEADAMELFKRFNNWYRKFYKNPTGVLESADSVAGKVVLKPQFSVFKEKDKMKVQSGIVRYTLIMGFKEGKYRYEIRDVNLKAASYIPIERLFRADDPDIADNYHTLKEAHAYFTDLVADLEAGMREPGSKVKTDDW